MPQDLTKYRLAAALFFSYAALSLLILFPVLPNFSSQLPFAANGDVRLSLTILFSNLKKIAGGDLAGIYHLPILYPLSHTLTAGINLFGQTLLALPLYLLHVRNPYIIYNFLVLLAYTAAGGSAYLFAREWIGERWIAWVCGALYVLMPYRVHNIPQLNLLFSFPVPLALLFFWRFLKNGRRRDLALFAASFLAQVLFDLSIAVFLAFTLALLFLLRQLLSGAAPRRSWLLLALAALPLALAVFALFHPYLSPATSFSLSDEFQTIPAFAYHSPLSFFSNWSYALLALKGIYWHQSPFSPGITVFILFMYAFVPYLERRWQKATAAVGLTLLLVPAAAVPWVFRRIAIAELNRICGVFLLLFLLALALLLFQVRSRLPRWLMALTLTWMVVQFFSSQICLPLFNLFQKLGALFPFILRMRFIRSEYILLLLAFTIAAVGLSHFVRRWRGKPGVVALALLLLFAERARWPVHAERLKDDLPGYQALYRRLAAYPRHFGLLELPWEPQYTNHYPLFTMLHGQHTYHGLVNYLNDPLQLQQAPQLQALDGFSGLGDREFLRSLKERGIRLLLLFNRGHGESERRTWAMMLRQVRRGEEASLYERVEKSRHGMLLVLGEREQGPRLRYFLPRFALAGKSRLACTIAANQERTAAFLFNGEKVADGQFAPNSESRICVDLRRLRLAKQENWLEVRSGPSLELVRVRIE